MSKYKRSGRPQSSRCKRTTRPRLEALESRLVLSTPATISGTVFNDLHVTVAIAADDPGLANRTVFVDLHNDGVLHSDDPSAVTDASGHYVITGVNPGTLRVVTYSGDNPTTPTAVVINSNSSTANFGLQPESTVLPTVPSPAPFAGGGNAVVEGLYRNILGRDADPAGLAYWDAQLKAGEAPPRSPVSSSSHPSTRPMWSSPITRPISAATAIRRGSHPGWPSSRRARARRRSRPRSSPRPSTAPSTSLTATSCNRSTRTSSAARAIRRGSTTGPRSSEPGRAGVRSRPVSSARPNLHQRAIDGDYNVFLARVGDTSGVNSWMAQVQNGSMTLAEVAALFAGSPEYATRASQEPAPATQLVVTTQPPASVTANAPFGLTVTAEDGSGNIATTYTGPVTLVLSGGTSGAMLGGTVTGTAVNGVAAFTGLTINTAGTGYTLTASSGTLTSATSSINVAPVTATKLVVTTTPPASVTANAPFGLTVTAEDGSGNIATTYNGPVTLVLSGGTSGAKLGGTVTITAVNGVAAFTGLTIDTAGTGYTLTASSGTLTPAPVTVTVTTASSTEPTAIPVISFHGIGTDPANFPYDMPLSTFTADMTALHNAGYHSITLQQYLDWEAGKNPVLPSKPILLTDDDGDASIQQMTSVLQSDGYTMVAFIVTGFIDNGDTYNVTWAQLQSMVASGTWEVAFHAGADGHYDYANGPPPGQQIEPNAPDFYADYFTANNGGVLETDAQYQARVTTELNQGIAELKAKIPSAYTNVFALPFNDYGEYAPDSPGGPQQQDLTTIFASRFTIVFVEDNDYPNSVDNNHHQYRFEVHNDTSTSDLLAALNDPAFTRFGLTVALTATQVVVTTPPPASVTAGGTFSLTVTAEDDAGNVDTTYNGPVMLILNGSDATATLGGTPVGEDAGNIVDAINGVATFSNLTINTAGTGYTIDAFAVDLPGWAETDPITVT